MNCEGTSSPGAAGLPPLVGAAILSISSTAETQELRNAWTSLSGEVHECEPDEAVVEWYGDFALDSQRIYAATVEDAVQVFVTSTVQIPLLDLVRTSGATPSVVSSESKGASIADGSDAEVGSQFFLSLFSSPRAAAGAELRGERLGTGWVASGFVGCESDIYGTRSMEHLTSEPSEEAEEGAS